MSHSAVVERQRWLNPAAYPSFPRPPAGCILGELILGKPLFPGSSTMNQLDRIMEFTGRPSAPDLDSVASPFAATMMENCTVQEPKRVTQLFPNISPEAADLLRRLLHFNPSKRITAADALRHPYVAQVRLICAQSHAMHGGCFRL